MRVPSFQTRVLASAPLFYGSWGVGIRCVYQWTQDPEAWPLVAGCAIIIAAVMKADEQVRAWKLWQAEWDALGDSPPRRRKRVPILRLLLTLPVFFLMLSFAQHGGSKAVIGLLLIFGLAALLLAAIGRLWSWARSGRRMRAVGPMPVTVCIRRAIVPVPSLDAAYRALPPYCQQLLGRPV